MTNHKPTGRQLIAGEWRSSGDERFHGTCPVDGRMLHPPFSEASPADVDDALAAAAAAANDLAAEEDPRWPAKLLDAIADAVADNAKGIYAVAEQETALPRGRLQGELARTVGQLRMFARLVERGDYLEAVLQTADPKRTPTARPDLRRIHCPIGPVAVFTASNFPLAFGVAGGDTASALAAGNPVVVKGHPCHPGTSEQVAAAVCQAVRTAGLPEGCFSLLQGRSPALSEALVRHPGLTAVGFTGSKRVGRRLFDLAAARPVPIPVFAEMSSVNPILVLPGALRQTQQLGIEIADAVALGTGQFCTKPGLLFCVGEIDALADAIGVALRNKGAMTMLGSRFRDDFLAAVSRGSAQPDVVVRLAPQPHAVSACTASVLLTTLDGFSNATDLHEEAFGPGVVVVNCPSVEAALGAITALGGQLTGTIRAGIDDHATLGRSVRAMSATCGRVIVNGVPTGVDVCDAMVHGGPFPATTAASTTSVGTMAIRRFLRPIAFQDVPDDCLPAALRDSNPLGLTRVVDGRRVANSLEPKP